jgi:hypothetical protein
VSSQGFLQTNSQLAELIDQPLFAGGSGVMAHIQTGEPQAMAACEQIYVMLRYPVDGIRIAHERTI